MPRDESPPLEHHLERIANAARLGFVPLALVSLGSPLDLVTVAVAGAIAVLPLVLEHVLGRRVASVVHLAVALGALFEAAGRTLELYEGHPVPFDLFAHAVEVGSVVVVVLTVLRWRWPAIEKSRALTLAVAASVGLLLAVGWEVIEATVDPFLSGTLQHGAADTGADIGAGVVGAVAAAALIRMYWLRVPAEAPGTARQTTG